MRSPPGARRQVRQALLFLPGRAVPPPVEATLQAGLSLREASLPLKGRHNYANPPSVGWLSQCSPPTWANPCWGCGCGPAPAVSCCLLTGSRCTHGTEKVSCPSKAHFPRNRCRRSCEPANQSRGEAGNTVPTPALERGSGAEGGGGLVPAPPHLTCSLGPLEGTQHCPRAGALAAPVGRSPLPCDL